MQRDIDPVSAALGATSPRHLDLARTLMQEIVNGNPPVGALLPTEAELCETWNLSRYAVRQAVQKLTNLGMVSRQAGVGTRVISDRPQSRFTQLMDSPADLVSYAKGTTLRTSAFGTVEADDTLAALLRCAPGASWLHIGGTRFDSAPGHEPIALVDIYVDRAYGDLPPPGETLDVPVYTMVEKQYGIKITRVEQEVQGWLVEGAQAAALQVPDKSAGLRIIRTYFLRDQAIIVTTGVHPASRFSYCSTYQLQQAGG
ncbi:GntR family transcriptional regulator [Cupriavidus taiwanensis]|uniref:Transcriptional regulator, gntR ubiC families n=1 Tax=Cupriavidus taiwanensis (strain DSM 17343 / BCRC 17206 / CCUG 44338 / CIP 107171 / LMG 19424 / R1) TaxID=977880 RepID=B2AH32_CUPTR|nr:GntR family transcriptional regulator [Cupriavidus taiwanensis]CAP63081.1 putative transcriptional regulator, gntR ubiC families [Cupriavidus taiwanensis LMG 19424]